MDAMEVCPPLHTMDSINSRRPIPVEEMDDPAEEDSDPQEITILGDLEDIAYRLLLEMPAGMRDVMNLSIHYGMENREIAEALRLPEGTVRTRLSRGRKWLKKKLTEKGVMLLWKNNRPWIKPCRTKLCRTKFCPELLHDTMKPCGRRNENRYRKCLKSFWRK